MKSVHYSHVGKRKKQEDYYGLIENKLYVLCDGVGGYKNGEVASKLVVDNTLKKFQTLEKPYNEINIQNLLFEVQLDLNLKLVELPDAVGMATTFCGVFIDEKAVYIAHRGDSRVYYIKSATSQIWHTWDHAEARRLVEINSITREEGRIHPNSHIIFPVFRANLNSKTVKADINKISCIKENDLIFICSDGIDEGWNEFELMKVLCDSKTDIAEKLNTIKKVCSIKSYDNNTALLIEIEKEDEIFETTNTVIHWLNIDDFEKDYQHYLSKLI
jgi:serine/threonine protein phosphatase PrpC